MSEKRQGIVRAAEELFYREGFEAVGIDRVVAEAGCALGTLYRHFDGRSALIVAALQQRDADYFDSLQAASGKTPGIAGALALFDGLKDWSARRGGNGCFFLRAASAYPDDPEVRAAAVAHKERTLALVRQRLAQAGCAGARLDRMTTRLFLLLEGAVSAALVTDFDTAVEEAKQTAEALLQAEGLTA